MVVGASVGIWVTVGAPVVPSVAPMTANELAGIPESSSVRVLPMMGRDTHERTNGGLPLPVIDDVEMS